MASTPRALAAIGRSSRLALPSRVASKSFSTATGNHLLPSARPTVATRLAATGRVAFRRSYADKAPKPKPGKLRTTFRWAWRLTYLSAAGLVGYTCYIVYQDRHPQPQFEPDPSKKTLVILGERILHPGRASGGSFLLTRMLPRHWLGFSRSAQKAGY
jgi:NADH:ubiquinone reductase (non-electrogenic)